MKSIVFFVIGILRLSFAAEDFHWGYHGNSGPSYWGQHFEGCAGKSQSPIDIPSEKNVEYAKDLGFVRFYGYEDVRIHKLKNNGHSLQIDVSGNSYIADAGPRGFYKAVQFHYHWGKTSTRGSEHTFDGTAFPMEMHIVHYKTEYGSIVEALKKPDGLAVLGFRFKLVRYNNVFYQKFLRKLPAVRNSGESTDTVPMRLADILPHLWHKLEYFRYNGSLTTPLCNEAVIWTVFKSPIYISSYQLMQFRDLYSNEKSNETYWHISDNFRPVQPLNNRRILKNFQSGYSKTLFA